MLIFGIALISLGSILPQVVTRFGLNDVEAGILTSILPLGILAGSLIVGPVVDRFSYRELLSISALLVGLGLEGIAFSTGYGLLQVSIFWIGFGGGALNTGTSALVSDISAERPERRSANMSFLGVFYGIGALGMPLLLSLLTRYLGQQTLIAWVGIALAIPALLFAFTIFPRAKQQQGFPLKKAG